MRQPTRDTMRHALILAGIMLSALVLRAYITGAAWWIGIDDANIYYVYVRNILDGHGIVFAPGGEVVEGFTSPLWLALLTLLSVGNILSVEAASLLLGVVSTFITLWLIGGAVRMQRGSLASWCVVVAILATPGVIDWMMMARLETPLWVLALTIAGLRMAYGKYDRWFYIALATLPLIRPEGFILGPLIAVAACYVCHGATRAVLRPSLLCAAIPITSALLLTLGRLAIFGAPLPNTYYAKVSSSIADNFSSGLLYNHDAFVTTMWVPTVLFVLVMLDARNTRAMARPKQAVCILIAALLSLPILTGGDHFAYARFQMPAVVFIWMLAARAFTLSKWRLAAAALTLVVMNISLPYLYDRRGSSFHMAFNMLLQEYNIARDGRMEADALEYIHAGGSLPRWGVTSAGGTAYAYAGECIDLLGLNNPRMARANARKSGPIHGHSSFNADVFFAQRPDILCVLFARNDSAALVRYHKEWDSTSAKQNIMHGNVVADARFGPLYGFARLTRDGVSMYGLVRKDWPLKVPTVDVTFL